MDLRFVRTLRTPSSERFLLQTAAGKDFAALELHYLVDHRVAGTLIVWDNAITDQDAPNLLEAIDEMLLPEVSRHEGNLSFTVVRGQVIGNFAPTGDGHVDSAG